MRTELEQDIVQVELIGVVGCCKCNLVVAKSSDMRHTVMQHYRSKVFSDHGGQSLTLP